MASILSLSLTLSFSVHLTLSVIYVVDLIRALVAKLAADAWYV